MREARQACPVCGLLEGDVIAAKSRDGSPMVTILCAGCGVARTDPMPDANELATFYRDQYRVEYKGVQVPRKKHVLRAGRLAAERLRALRKDIPAGGALLDIGAGGGEFVYLAGACGYQARGIEQNAGYANYARTALGLAVEGGVWQTANVSPGSLNAVTMFHVLEHLPDPVACLRAVRAWLAPRGALFVEVPNLCTPVGDPARRFHKAHLVHFTPETLRFTAQQSGFEVLWSHAPGDGANVRLMARAAEPEPGIPAPDSEIARQILAHERSLPKRPYLRLAAWLRLLRRAATMGEEIAAASVAGDRKAILHRHARSL